MRDGASWSVTCWPWTQLFWDVSSSSAPYSVCRLGRVNVPKPQFPDGTMEMIMVSALSGCWEDLFMQGKDVQSLRSEFDKQQPKGEPGMKKIKSMIHIKRKEGRYLS